MKTQITQFYFIQLITVVFIFNFLFFGSCKKEEPASNESSFNYEQIGIIHNSGLDYVFNYVKEKTANNKSVLKSQDDLLSLVEEGTREFLTENEIFDEAGRKIALKESKKPFVFYSDCLKDNLKSSTLAGLCPSELEIYLTNNQKTILSEMDEIFNDNFLDVPGVISSLDNLEEKILSDCPEKEQHVLLCATSIGRYSFQYWSDNLDVWIDEFSPNNKLKKAQFSWATVGKNDVAYGVGGGVAGAIVGGSLTLGVLSIPGWAAGAIGGAVSGSIGNAILQLW